MFNHPGFAMRQIVMSLAALVGGLLPLHAGPARAQSSASFDIPRQSVDGGAGRSASASYVLTTSVGQPDATRADAPSYQLSGGFLRAADLLPDALFRDGFE